VRDPGLPDLTGTVTVVTGAGGGIGAGIARRFAAAGAAVVAHYRSGGATAVALVEEITGGGVPAAALQADLTDVEGCRRLLVEARRRFGRLDAVVAAAGVQPVRALYAMTAEEWREVVEVNLTASFRTVRAAAEVLGRGDGGSITLVASIEGGRPAVGHAHYAASKAGVITLARSAALEYGRQRIRVNTVSPGLIWRDGLDTEWPAGVRSWRAAAPLGRVGAPSDVGDACVFLASPLAAWITGHDLIVDGGMSTRPAW
jgi:NAD(P)-dependent dehydrogenase (short-subunit alcohol dehydrogenase family)